METNIAIATPRLLLRTFEDSDAQRYVEIETNPGVYKECPPKEFPTVEKFHAGIKNLQSLGIGLLAIVLKESGLYIGRCGLAPFGIGEYDIQIFIDTPYQHKGFGPEVYDALAIYAFVTQQRRYLFAVIHEKNADSIKFFVKRNFALLEKRGNKQVYRFQNQS